MKKKKWKKQWLPDYFFDNISGVKFINPNKDNRDILTDLSEEELIVFDIMSVPVKECLQKPVDTPRDDKLTHREVVLNCFNDNCAFYLAGCAHPEPNLMITRENRSHNTCQSFKQRK